MRMASSAFLCGVVLLLIGCLPQDGQARIFTDEELARELVNRHGFPVEEINDWVCLVKGESNGDTSAMNTNKNGSKDWGIFQINDYWWCGGHHRGRNGCNVRCEDLAKDDITAAAKCAKIIRKRQGFKAWVAWVKRCEGKHLTDYRYLFGCGQRT